MNSLSEREILEGLCRVLVGEGDILQAQTVYRKMSETSRVLDVAGKHKVVTILSGNINLLKKRYLISDSDPFIDLCNSETRKALLHRDILRSELADLMEKLKCSPITSRMLMLKGLSLQEYYPRGYIRWMRDVDIMLDSASDMLEVYNLLVNSGYIIDCDELPWIKRDTSRNLPLYGQTFMVKAKDDDFGRFDLHYTHYSVSYSAWLDHDLWRDSRIMDLNGLSLRVLSTESCLLLLFAHMLSQGYIAIKDVNDLASICLATTVDWDYVLAAAEQNQLLPQIRKTMDYMTCVYSASSIGRICAGIAKLARVSLSKYFWQPYNRSWSLRAVVNSLFTFSFERKHNSASLRTSFAIALACLLYYMRRLRLEWREPRLWESIVARILPHYVPNRGMMTRMTCVLLVPIAFRTSASVRQPDRSKCQSSVSLQPRIESVTLSNDIEFFWIGATHLVLFSQEGFIPTSDLIISPSAEQQAQRLFTQLISGKGDRKPVSKKRAGADG